jgi:hypothetical protein
VIYILREIATLANWSIPANLLYPGGTMFQNRILKILCAVSLLMFFSIGQASAASGNPAGSNSASLVGQDGLVQKVKESYLASGNPLGFWNCRKSSICNSARTIPGLFHCQKPGKRVESCAGTD